ncbi:MAG: FkbM family methyltransferase [Candidatus Nanopelagicaceae bacterium]
MRIVQVGANKGYDDLSNHLLTHYDNIEFGLFVEPNPVHIDSLKECYKKYPNAIFDQRAIKSTLDPRDEMELFYFDNDVLSNYEKASSKIEHLEKHKSWNAPGCDGNISSFKAESITLDNLFYQYGIRDLDWLMLDIEGMDAEIILTFDWKKYNIGRVEFEHYHLGPYGDPILNMFHGMRYVPVPALNPYYDCAFQKIRY